MKLSLAISNYSWPGGAAAIAEALRDVALAADEAGADTVWVADHLLQVDPNATVDDPMLEAYTTLGYLAAATTSVGLGTLVTWASIRPPALVVKLVTTVDVLSGGRAWLGLGAGYRGDEAEMMGLPFGPTGERFEQLEELLLLAEQMWRDDRGPFEGRHHRLSHPIGSPLPVSRPRVLIGGMGERRTLPLVARYADACNLFDVPDGGATLRRKLDVIAGSCEEVGRDVKSVEVTLSSRLRPGETVDSFAERCGELAGLGVDHVVLLTTGPWHRGGDLDVALDAVEPLAQL